MHLQGIQRQMSTQNNKSSQVRPVEVSKVRKCVWQIRDTSSQRFLHASDNLFIYMVCQLKTNHDSQGQLKCPRYENVSGGKLRTMPSVVCGSPLPLLMAACVIKLSVPKSLVHEMMRRENLLSSHASRQEVKRNRMWCLPTKKLRILMTLRSRVFIKIDYTISWVWKKNEIRP